MGTVTSIFQGANFDPDTTRAMGDAFDAACKDLNGGGQPEIVREIIAKRILAAARNGERDPHRLRAKALDALGMNPRAG